YIKCIEEYNRDTSDSTFTEIPCNHESIDSDRKYERTEDDCHEIDQCLLGDPRADGQFSVYKVDFLESVSDFHNYSSFSSFKPPIYDKSKREIFQLSCSIFLFHAFSRNADPDPSFQKADIKRFKRMRIAVDIHHRKPVRLYLQPSGLYVPDIFVF